NRGVGDTKLSTSQARTETVRIGATLHLAPKRKLVRRRCVDDFLAPWCGRAIWRSSAPNSASRTRTFAVRNGARDLGKHAVKIGNSGDNIIRTGGHQFISGPFAPFLFFGFAERSPRVEVEAYAIAGIGYADRPCTGGAAFLDPYDGVIHLHAAPGR